VGLGKGGRGGGNSEDRGWFVAYQSKYYFIYLV